MLAIKLLFKYLKTLQYVPDTQLKRSVCLVMLVVSRNDIGFQGNIRSSLQVTKSNIFPSTDCSSPVIQFPPCTKPIRGRMNKSMLHFSIGPLPQTIEPGLVRLIKCGHVIRASVVTSLIYTPLSHSTEDVK